LLEHESVAALHDQMKGLRAPILQEIVDYVNEASRRARLVRVLGVDHHNETILTPQYDAVRNTAWVLLQVFKNELVCSQLFRSSHSLYGSLFAHMYMYRQRKSMPCCH